MKTLLKYVSIVAVLLGAGLSAEAASNERIYADIIVTNAVGTTNGNTITINGNIRRFTNAVMSATTIVATNVPGFAATNLYNQIADYRVTNITGSVSLTRLTTTNGIRLTALPGDPLAVSVGGTWGIVTLQTNAAATNAYALQLPLETFDAQTRTNHANDLVTALQFASTGLADTLPAFQNFANLDETQTLSNKTLQSTLLLSGMVSNVVAHLVNAYLTNSVLTNGTIKGATITSNSVLHYARINEGAPGLYLVGTLPATNRLTVSEEGWPEVRTLAGITATNTAPVPAHVLNYASLLLYFPNLSGTRTNTWSTTNRAMSGLWIFGPNTLIASNATFYSAWLSNAVHRGPFQSYSNYSTALELGLGAHADADFAVVAGNDAFVGTDGGIAIGHDARVTSGAGVAIGEFSVSSNLNSVAIMGNTTASQQIMRGTDQYKVEVPGFLHAGVLTNNTYGGVNTNQGDWSDPALVVTSIADGNNIAVASTNVYMRFTGSPTAAWGLAGLTGGRNGRILDIENATGYPMTLLHNSGLDPTPGNRIYSSTLGDIVLPNLGWAFLRYDATLGRWKVRGTAPVVANVSIDVNTNQFDGTLPLVLKAGAAQTNANFWGSGTNRGDFVIQATNNPIVYLVHLDANRTSLWSHANFGALSTHNFNFYQGGVPVFRIDTSGNLVPLQPVSLGTTSARWSQVWGTNGMFETLNTNWIWAATDIGTPDAADRMPIVDASTASLKYVTAAELLGGGESQTPWLSDIDGDLYALYDAGRVHIVQPVTDTNATFLIKGPGGGNRFEVNTNGHTRISRLGPAVAGGNHVLTLYDSLDPYLLLTNSTGDATIMNAFGVSSRGAGKDFHLSVNLSSFIRLDGDGYVAHNQPSYFFDSVEFSGGVAMHPQNATLTVDITTNHVFNIILTSNTTVTITGESNYSAFFKLTQGGSGGYSFTVTAGKNLNSPTQDDICCGLIGTAVGDKSTVFVELEPGVTNAYEILAPSSEILASIADGTKRVGPAPTVTHSATNAGISAWVFPGKVTADTTSSRLLSSGLLEAYPAFISPGCWVDGLSFRVTAAGTAGSKFIGGIYSNTSSTNFYPASLVLSSIEMDGDYGGGTTNTTVTATFLEEGWYWIAYAGSTPVTMPTLTGLSPASISGVLGMNQSDHTSTRLLRVARTYDSTMPASFPASATRISSANPATFGIHVRNIVE